MARYFLTRPVVMLRVTCFMVFAFGGVAVNLWGLASVGMVPLPKKEHPTSNALPTTHSHCIALRKMDILKSEEIELPAAFDAHVHLRDGEMAQLVTPTVRQGGVNQVYVMVRLMLDSIHTSRCRDASLLLLHSVPIT
jgi:hypothetical protein